MTLTIGDHVVIKRSGKLVEGEAYHEFEVEEVTYLGGSQEANDVRYDVRLRMVE